MTKHMKLTVRGSLAEVNPDLAAQLVDQSLATTAMPWSHKKVKWRGDCGHEWETQVHVRAKDGKGNCPYCSGRLIIPGETDLATTNPSLAAQLVDQSLATALTSRSSKRVKWRCEKGHIWKASASQRIDGYNCPYCLNPLVIPDKTDLATANPSLAAQLVDQSLATTLTSRSYKRVEWRCEKGHIWEASVGQRVDGYNCPYCNNKKILVGFNDLATTHPEYAATLADKSIAKTIRCGSYKKVEWICQQDSSHRWMTPPRTRLHADVLHGCPICQNQQIIVGYNDLKTTHPELASQLVDQSLATTLVSGSVKRVEWCCEKGHKWVATPNSRVAKNHGCPYCSGLLAIPGETDLATVNPDIASELVDQSLATELLPSSQRKVLWRCKNGHTWSTTPHNRTHGKGCPYCANKKVLVGFNDLATTHPELAAQLVDRSLATKMTAGSAKKVEWRCEKGHIWKTSANIRHHGSGCPYCTNRKILPGFNDLATVRPDLASQLVDPDIATKVGVSSSKKVKWRCELGHEWKTSVSKRIYRNAGCPTCKQSHGERFIRNYLERNQIIAKEQWRNNQCRLEKTLAFDSALFNDESAEKPIACIEYHGLQHFTPVDYFGGKRIFERQQRRDDAKRQFCKENSIPLIEIPFSFDTQELVDAILDACLASITATRTQ